MTIKEFYTHEEELRILSLTVDLLHYLKMYRNDMDDNVQIAMATIIDYFGNMEFK